MQPQGIRQETLDQLIDCATSPSRLGGRTRGFSILRRKYGADYKAVYGQDFRTTRDLRNFFSSMLEEEAASLISELKACMPDLTQNTVHATVRRLLKAA